MDSDLRLEQQVCFALYAASRASTSAYRHALASVGLTYPQYLALLALWEEDGLTVRQLGDRLLLDSGTLSPLLSRLEHAGLVERSRSADDGRRVLVRLTAAGARLRAEAETIQCSLLDRLDMPEEDLAQLRTLAQRLVTSLERADRVEGADRLDP
ncbi:MarR family transcriptional regulator [Rhodococcus sp. IEGM 1408]|uniref:MarR family winged helix-turn-helix transcriptional regulator n=1 Tax=Rhodococcus sp. IEGM 1408 TaxID=3082220 RepID=UPI002955CE53|nr:MarR family transcriptional regulator [Rhodococcus sp. IEGM 1408]MDV8000180.1 MarR family transcriptional regulator [Rhodococcus sp. IEGM 1408]